MIHPTFIRTALKKSAQVALAAVVIGIPTLAVADTVCEKGKITIFELADGGDSTLYIGSTDSPAADWQRANRNAKKATKIWYTNGTRWRDDVTLLRTAFALGLPMKLVSNDPDCFGSQDEFSVTVCALDGAGCN